MKRTRRHHSPEFKREAVALVLEHGYSCTAAGHSLGVSGVLIGRCIVDPEIQTTSLVRLEDRLNGGHPWGRSEFDTVRN